MRLSTLTLALLVLLGCSAPQPSAPRPTATATVVQPTMTPRPATPTPQPNYRELRNKLANPLSAMIVSIRDNDRSTAAAFLAQFNAAADAMLPILRNDPSDNAALLQSAIVSVRAQPGNLAQLTTIRERLELDIT